MEFNEKVFLVLQEQVSNTEMENWSLKWNLFVTKGTLLFFLSFHNSLMGSSSPRMPDPLTLDPGFWIPNSWVPPKWIRDSIEICGFWIPYVYALDSAFQSLTFAGFRIPSHRAKTRCSADPGASAAVTSALGQAASTRWIQYKTLFFK